MAREKQQRARLLRIADINGRTCLLERRPFANPNGELRRGPSFRKMYNGAFTQSEVGAVGARCGSPNAFAKAALNRTLTLVRRNYERSVRRHVEFRWNLSNHR